MSQFGNRSLREELNKKILLNKYLILFNFIVSFFAKNKLPAFLANSETWTFSTNFNVFAGPQGCIKSESCMILKLIFCIGFPFVRKPQSPNFEIMILELRPTYNTLSLFASLTQFSSEGKKPKTSGKLNINFWVQSKILFDTK